MPRILFVALTVLVVTAAPAAAQPPGHVVSLPDTLKWVEPAVLPGARLAIVQGDPGKEGLFVYRFKFPADFKVPAHFHKASENVTVLAGSFFIGLGDKADQGSAKELPVGGFVAIPPAHPHFAWAGAQETIVQVHGVGPTDITFVNQDKFQIIHCCINDRWDQDTFKLRMSMQYGNPTGTNFLTFPEGPFVGDIADTIVNFTTETKIEDAQK